VVKKQNERHSDTHLFREKMTGVVPLKTEPKTDSKPPRKVKRTHAPEKFSARYDPAALSSAGGQHHIDADDGSSHRKNGIQKRTMQKLKRGQFAVGAELDLHNMTTEKAQTVLLEFIEEALTESLVSVRVIHGKGLRSTNGPRIKLMTRQLLRDHPGVLAYTNCKPADGGDGAVHVLLKSS
jgi:DNA-nicking Smr family endonuclease